MKNRGQKKAEISSASALFIEEKARQTGIPAFLIRVAGWERVKQLRSLEMVRYHCD